MAALTIRPEVAEDDPFLRRLTIEGRWAEFAPLPLADAHKRMLLEQQDQARRHHYRTFYAGADFSVLELDGVAVGRLCLLRGPHDHKLVDIALLPEQCGSGLGGTLLDSILAEAATLGRSVSLRVEHTNPARRLYERKGFRETERSEIDAEMEWHAPLNSAS
ncbi:GNAT family N-acetyltransferase [Sphingomonas psychrolutea]|uniref:N-acetyltransferase n=1 Tax=Sphingomonas psychrolutea TaxID=1259676 RepID=A0ABQ1GEF2_9SPHN|nr:GNAT family N-acetyltransferase [Sphingomonas psychrolutea]GGA42150.1 N-acetyltransferase [Sphingomonas psychrolutea]